MNRFQATLDRVSRVVNAPFIRNAKAKKPSKDDDEFKFKPASPRGAAHLDDDSPPISPRRNILTRCDTRCILMTNRELALEFPEEQISPRLIFDNPTIESIAEHLCNEDRRANPPSGWAPATQTAGWPRSGKEKAQPFTQLVIDPEDDFIPSLGKAFESLYEPAGTSRYFRSSDGMECVLMPRAQVWIGSNEANSQALPMEKPCHQVELSSFLIDIEPVSIGAYARFLNLVKPPIEALQDWIMLSDIDERHCHLPLRCKGNNVWEAAPGVPLSWPMIMVSWYGANAYSLWANGYDWRSYHSATQSFLPTEAQWEYAARGCNCTLYPWGDEPASPELLNACFNMDAHDPFSHTSLPLESFPILPVNVELGVSPFGLRHMAGNVLQWCRDTYSADFYSSAAASSVDPCNITMHGLKCERGGNWVEPPEVARSSYRRGRAAEGMGRCLGFRCVGAVHEAHAAYSDLESTSAGSDA